MNDPTDRSPRWPPCHYMTDRGVLSKLYLNISNRKGAYQCKCVSFSRANSIFCKRKECSGSWAVFAQPSFPLAVCKRSKSSPHFLSPLPTKENQFSILFQFFEIGFYDRARSVCVRHNQPSNTVSLPWRQLKSLLRQMSLEKSTRNEIAKFTLLKSIKNMSTDWKTNLTNVRQHNLIKPHT